MRKVVISVVILAIFVGFLVYYIDFKEFIKHLKDVNISLLILIVPVQLLVYLLRAIRFELILEKKGVLMYSAVSAVHGFFNKIMPIRSGELSLPLLFKRYNKVSYAKGTSALIMVRVLDLFAVLFLFALSLLFISVKNIDHFLLTGIAFFILGLLVFVWIKLNLILKLISSALERSHIRLLNRFKERILLFIGQVSEYRKSRVNSFIIKLFVVSVATWLLTYFAFLLLLLSFDLSFTFMEVIFATTFVSFSTLIPVSAVGGFGTYEAGWALGYVILGMSLDLAVPMGLFANIFGIIISAVFGLLGYLFLVYTKQ